MITNHREWITKRIVMAVTGFLVVRRPTLNTALDPYGILLTKIVVLQKRQNVLNSLINVTHLNLIPFFYVNYGILYEN